MATTKITGTGLDIDNATDIGAAIVDADLFIIDDGAGGTIRKTAASRLKTYVGGSDPASADGDSLGTASLEWSDLYLADGGIIYFGNDQDVTVTHDPDDGLFLKSKATADDNPFLLTLQTGETDMAASDIIGALQFQAPDEGTGTDAILVSAAVKAYAEGDHSSSSNATSLAFYTGASEAATEKMTIKSDGKVGIGVTGSSIDEIFHIGTSTNDATLKMESTGGNAMIDIVGNRTSDADIGHLRFHNGSTAALAQIRVERSGANNSGLLKLQASNAGSMATVLQSTPAGEITMPLQPSVLAIPSSTQSDIPANATTDVAFATEVYDVNGDFSTPTFTAPVTGKYFVAANLRLNELDTGANYYYLVTNTSNRIYYSHILDPDHLETNDPAYWTFRIATITDMDASDTLKIQIRQDGGAQQTDIEASEVWTWLSVALIA